MVVQITLTVDPSRFSLVTDSTTTSTSAVREQFSDRSGIGRTAAVLAGVVLAALVANVAAILAATTAIGSDAGQTTTFVAVAVGTELSFLLVGAAYLRVRSSFRLPLELPSRAARPYLLGGLLASFVAAVCSLAITDALVPAIELSPGYAEYSGLGDVTGAGLAVGAVLSLAVIGPVEEFFFRGVIQGRLREALGPASAVGIGGAVFALFHVYPVALVAPPVAVLAHMGTYYAVMGAIFGWVYHRTDTLVGPILVHGTFNAVVFASPFVF